MIMNDTVRQPAESWGPPMWRTIHSVAYASPPVERFRAFLRGLSGVLPCAKCAHEFARILDEGDPGAGIAPIDALRDDDDLLEWTVRVHAKISPSPTTTWTREMAAASLTTPSSAQTAQALPDPTKRPATMIGPNALALGLALGFLIAAVAIGALYAIGTAIGTPLIRHFLKRNTPTVAKIPAST